MQIESNQTTKRKTPTQRQVEALGQLTHDQLIGKALEALHALNRRAKTKRDDRNRYRRASFAKTLDYQIDEIYALKDQFLEALVLGGRAKLYTFVVHSHSLEVVCGCGRNWYGSDDCYRCGDEGQPTSVEKRWFVVEALDYRFHQPSMSPAAAAAATPIPPHDPEQRAREVPDVTIELRSGARKTRTTTLTIEAQMAGVRMALDALKSCVVPPEVPQLSA